MPAFRTTPAREARQCFCAPELPVSFSSGSVSFCHRCIIGHSPRLLCRHRSPTPAPQTFRAEPRVFCFFYLRHRGKRRASVRIALQQFFGLPDFLCTEESVFIQIVQPVRKLVHGSEVFHAVPESDARSGKHKRLMQGDIFNLLGLKNALNYPNVFPAFVNRVRENMCAAVLPVGDPVSVERIVDFSGVTEGEDQADSALPDCDKRNFHILAAGGGCREIHISQIRHVRASRAEQAAPPAG